MPLKVKVARGLKWQVINIAGRQLLSLVVFTTLARLLEPHSFGLMGLVGVYLGFVGMFADQGIGAALIQRQHLEKGHLDTAFWFNTGCSVVLCLGTMALADPMAVYFGEPKLAPLLRWSSLALVIGAASTIHATLFIKDMDFRRPAIRTMVANAMGGVVGILMALDGLGVWALVGQQLGVAIAGAVFLWSVSTYRPSFRFSVKNLRELFSVSMSVFGSAFLWFVVSRLDQLVIGRFAGTPDLGLYVIANKLPDFGKVVTLTPIDQVSLPALSQLQNDYERMRQAIYQGMELTALVSFAIFGGIAAVAWDLVPFLFGAKWTAAGTWCALLSVYGLVTTLEVFFHPVLLAAGGAGKYVFLNILQVAGVLIAAFFGVRFGISYLICGLIINNLAIAFPALRMLRQRIGLSPWEYCKPCLVPALGSIVMAGMVWLCGRVLPLKGLLAVALACKILVGSVTYIGFVFVFNRATLTKLYDVFAHAFLGEPT